MNKRWIALALTLIMALTLAGCAGNDRSAAPTAATPPTAETAETAEPVTLTVAGSWPDFRALDVIAKAFSEKYPNCTIVYEYLQDYYPSLEKRLDSDDPVDLFMSTNIQDGSELLPYALDVYSAEGLDLSETNEGLIQNFEYRGGAEGKAQLYSVPLGAEMRGLYVNKTMLDSFSIPMPTDQKSLLAACQAIKEQGYIPFHGNPGKFAQTLIYPWICNLIVHADDPKAAYDRINNKEPGSSDIVQAPYTFLYTLVENDYYDYKRAQTDLNLFIDSTDEAYARDFLNIRQDGDSWVKADDLGQVAFMPSPMSLESVIAKTKEDYHSGIEYAFIPAPVSDEGGYCYLSPAHGIAVYKDTPHQEWAIRFLDFLFKADNSKLFAEAFDVIPNTKDALGYIRTRFDVPDSRVSELGQVTFSFGFYEALQDSMTNLSKCNNPKYMLDDGAGNLSLPPLETFMEAAETALHQ